MIKSYNKMPVRMYEELTKIIRTEKKEEMRNIAIAALLSGHTKEDILNMPFEEAVRIFCECGFIFEKPKADGLRKVYKVGDWRLKLMRDEEMTCQQGLDLELFGKKGDIISILTCMLIPEGVEKYNEGYDLVKLRNDIADHLTVTEANGIFAYYMHRMINTTREAIAHLQAVAILHPDEAEATNTAIEQLNKSIKGCEKILEQIE